MILTVNLRKQKLGNRLDAKNKFFKISENRLKKTANPIFELLVLKFECLVLEFQTLVSNFTI